MGIFIANMLFFHTPYLYVDPYSWFTHGDAVTFQWIDIFVQGSFYPIFALLFGYGINMQYEKSIQRNSPLRPCHGEAFRDIAWRLGYCMASLSGPVMYCLRMQLWAFCYSCLFGFLQNGLPYLQEFCTLSRLLSCTSLTEAN